MQVLPAYPGLQVTKAGWPFTQADAALGNEGTGLLHAPQLARLLDRFASQPLLATPSQSAYLQRLGKACAIHILLPKLPLSLTVSMHQYKPWIQKPSQPRMQVFVYHKATC
jgi:hypothetical protein